MIFKFAKNKAKIQIIQKDSKSAKTFDFPKTMLEDGDMEFEKDGKIDDLSQSNIGVHILNHPFSFYFYSQKKKF